MTTGPKQPPPSHVRGWTNGTPTLARTLAWKVIAVLVVIVIAAAWFAEKQIRAFASDWWHNRALSREQAEEQQTAPETQETRRTYADMREDVKVEEQQKQEEKKAETKTEESTAKTGGRKVKREPTLKELARDSGDGAKAVFAEALPDPDAVDGSKDRAGGTDDDGGIQKVSHDSRGRMTDADGTEFKPGSECQVNAGTPVLVQLQTAIDTARPGGQAIGRVVKNVYDTATGRCLAIPANSTFYGEYAQTTVKGAKAADLVFTSLTRPYPRNDTLEFAMPASDAMGRGGVNGRVNSHVVGNIVLTAIATGVQLLPALVAKDGGTGSLAGAALGAFLGNAETPLNKAAREQLEKPSTIEMDPNIEGDRKNSLITVILRRHINADHFDSKAQPQGTNVNQRRPGRIRNAG